MVLIRFLYFLMKILAVAHKCEPQRKGSSSRTVREALTASDHISAFPVSLSVKYSGQLITKLGSYQLLMRDWSENYHFAVEVYVNNMI